MTILRLAQNNKIIFDVSRRHRREKHMTLSGKIIGIVYIAILVIALIYFNIDNYFTYKRLDKAADKLISEPDMSNKDKSTNLQWLSMNCMRFSRRSIIFCSKYDNIVNKIQSFLLSSDNSNMK